MLRRFLFLAPLSLMARPRRAVQAFYLIRVQKRGRTVQERIPVVVYTREDIRNIERLRGFIRWIPARPAVP